MVKRRRTSRRANNLSFNMNNVMNRTMDTVQLGMGLSAMSYAFGTTANLLKVK